MEEGAALKGFIVAIMSCACLAAQASATQMQRAEYSEVAMGVRARIVVYARDQESARTACKAAFAKIARLEDIMSDYRPTSELMRLCENAGGPPVKVSPDLLSILVKSQELSQRSDGAFDVTVGPLVRLWRQVRKDDKLPDPAERALARKMTGWKNLRIDKQASTVAFAMAGMRLDLGGIAKGYACDQALAVLKSKGIKSALIEMGGDIAVSAPPPGTKGWEIEIPNAPNGQKRQTLANRGISSSGDTEQFVEIDGKRYSHIVDPHTGLGLTNRIAVTVIAPDCTTSDGLSTAISVLGEERGRPLARVYKGTRVFVQNEYHTP